MDFYLINLDRSAGRLEWMRRQLDELKISFQRIAAIDGTQFDAESLQHWQSIASKQFRPGPCEIACFLSHRIAWSQVANGQSPWAFIAEDDILIHENLAQFLGDDTWIPPDADIVKAETVQKRVWMARCPKHSYGAYAIQKLQSYHGGSAGYFVNRSAASTLLERTLHISVSPDQVLFNRDIGANSGLGIYQIDPALVAQEWVIKCQADATEALTSTILAERDSHHVQKLARSRSFRGYLKHKITSPASKSVQVGIGYIANLIGTHTVKKIRLAHPMR